MSSPLPDISKTDIEIINCLNHNGFDMKKYLHLQKKTNSSLKKTPVGNGGSFFLQQ